LLKPVKVVGPVLGNLRTGKTASIEATFVRELYNTLFHGSPGKSLETSDYPFGDLVMG
jgi:hypothetical protein